MATHLIFITGFEPFGGSRRNFSLELVNRVAEIWSEPGLELVTGRLPTLYAGAVESAREQLASLRERPAFMVSLGEANRTQIQLETAAWNRDDAVKADNVGAVRRAAVIDPLAPERRGFAFPVQAMFATAEDGDDVTLSISPGNFVCNHTAFRLAGELKIPFTFIHVPATQHAPDLEGSARTISRLLAGAAEFQQKALPGDYPLPHASNAKRLPASRAEVDSLLLTPEKLGASDPEFLRQLAALYGKP